MSFNENYIQEAKSDIAEHMVAMAKFAESKDFESAHTEAVLIISAYWNLTEQLLIHIQGKAD